MTRFWLWMLLAFVGCVAVWFGLCKPDTGAAAAYSSAIALWLHWLFGEEA